MEDKNKTIVLYTSGIPLVLFSALTIMCLWVAVAGTGASLISIIQKDNAVFLHMRVEYNCLVPVILVVGDIFYAWMIYYFIFYLLSNRIVLSNDSLIIEEYVMPYNSSQDVTKYLVPKKRRLEIKIENIKSIILGSGRSLRRLAKEKNDSFLKAQINAIKQEELPLIGAAGLTWHARQFSPSILIIEKDNKKHFISVKPFSKRGVLKLLNNFKERTIII